MNLAAARSARAVTWVHAAARAAALFASTVGVLVLVGWLLDFRPFMQVLPGQAAMAPHTAIAFILAGLALRCRAATETRSRLQAIPPELLRKRVREVPDGTRVPVSTSDTVQ